MYEMATDHSNNYTTRVLVCLNSPPGNNYQFGMLGHKEISRKKLVTYVAKMQMLRSMYSENYDVEYSKCVFRPCG